MNNAEENRTYVRELLEDKQPLFAAILPLVIVDVIVKVPPLESIVGFGELDFEHGAKGPSLGSDEVL